MWIADGVVLFTFSLLSENTFVLGRASDAVNSSVFIPILLFIQILLASTMYCLCLMNSFKFFRQLVFKLLWLHNLILESISHNTTKHLVLSSLKLPKQKSFQGHYLTDMNEILKYKLKNRVINRMFPIEWGNINIIPDKFGV